jgi:hypothetical protein
VPCIGNAGRAIFHPLLRNFFILSSKRSCFVSVRILIPDRERRSHRFKNELGMVTNMDKYLHRRKFWVAFGLMTAGGIVYNLLRPESLEGGGIRLANCILNKDMVCLHEFIPEEELVALGTSREIVHEELHHLLKVRDLISKFKGGRITTKIHIENPEGAARNEVCEVVIPLETSVRGKSYWKFFVTKTERGIRGRQLVSSLILSQSSDILVPTAVPKFVELRQSIRFAELYGPGLERSGLGGIWAVQTGQPGTWREYASAQRNILARSAEGREELARLNAGR